MTGAAQQVRVFRARRPWLYRVCTGALCLGVYFAFRYSFASVPEFNDQALLSPAAGLGPVLCMFFGVPGIIGCLAGELACWLLLHETLAAILSFTVERILYLGGPYLAWYATHMRDPEPHPRFRSSRDLAVYLAIALADSVAIVVLEEARYRLTALPEMNDINRVVLGLNSLTFLVYLGMPALVALNRSPLYPNEPARVRARLAASEDYLKEPRMDMTQRMVIGAIVAAVGIILVMNILYLAPYPFYQEYGRMMPDIISGFYALTSIFVVVVFVPLICALRFMERRYTRPVENVTRFLVSFLDDVRDGRAEAAHVDTGGTEPLDEVGELICASEQLRSDLVDYIGQLGEATAERERAAAELDVAHRIQMSVIPKDFSALRTARCVDIHGFMRPAREVGGDFFDVLDLGEGRVGFLIGDVSGKGVPAALFMMRALNELRYQLISCGDPGEALTRADRVLSPTNDVEIFVTVFACVLDTASGHVAYANAGHNPPWLHRAGGGMWMACDPERVLGAYRIHTYTTHGLELRPGEGLVLYTDGISEAVDLSEGRRRFYGPERFERAICAGPGADAEGSSGAEALVECVLADVERFCAGAPQADDMTMLAFIWQPKS